MVHLVVPCQGRGTASSAVLREDNPSQSPAPSTPALQPVWATLSARPVQWWRQHSCRSGWSCVLNIYSFISFARALWMDPVLHKAESLHQTPRLDAFLRNAAPQVHNALCQNHIYKHAKSYI